MEAEAEAVAPAGDRGGSSTMRQRNRRPFATLLCATTGRIRGAPRSVARPCSRLTPPFSGQLPRADRSVGRRAQVLLGVDDGDEGAGESVRLLLNPRAGGGGDGRGDGGGERASVPRSNNRNNAATTTAEANDFVPNDAAAF